LRRGGSELKTMNVIPERARSADAPSARVAAAEAYRRRDKDARYRNDKGVKAEGGDR